MRIRVAAPSISPAANAAVARELEAGNIAIGPCVEQFEQEFAAAIGCEHVIAVSSCSEALETCFRWLASVGQESVTLPAITFASVRNAAQRHLKVEYTNQLTVNCVGGMDSAHVCRTGQMNDLGPEAVSCFSFYPTKPLSGIGGGAICTNYGRFAAWARVYTRNGLERRGTEWNYRDSGDGAKFAMNNLQAAYLLEQLKTLDKINAYRDMLAAQYRVALGEWEPEPCRAGSYTFCMDFGSYRARERVRLALLEAGIETTVQFQTLCPGILDQWYYNTLCLPLHPQLKPEDVTEIIGIVSDNLDSKPKVAAKPPRRTKK